MSSKKIALVLGGGSAYGFAHIGVINALIERGVKPDLIVGTSMGAIVGAYFALNGEVQSLVDIIRETKPSSLLADPGFFTLGMIKGEKIEKKLHEIYDGKKFSDCKTELIINACDVNKGETVVFQDGFLRDAVRASMSVPGIFAPYIFEGKMLVDGGLTNNLAVDLVPPGYTIIASKVIPKKGAEINVKEINTKNPLKRWSMSFNLISKSFSIMISKLEDSVVKNNPDIIFIDPDLNEFGYSTFDQFYEIINKGYVTAKKKLEKYPELIYTFDR